MPAKISFGFFLWAGQVTKLDFSTQVWPVILAGAGMGLMLTPASTDAINRASRLSYGEATGITQTGTYLGAVVGPVLFGLVAEHVSFRAAWLGAAAMALLAALTIVGARRRVRAWRDPARDGAGDERHEVPSSSRDRSSEPGGRGSSD